MDGLEAVLVYGEHVEARLETRLAHAVDNLAHEGRRLIGAADAVRSALHAMRGLAACEH